VADDALDLAGPQPAELAALALAQLVVLLVRGVEVDVSVVGLH
jgi:hypothetical protein